jgi:hypothetical protein
MNKIAGLLYLTALLNCCSDYKMNSKDIIGCWLRNKESNVEMIFNKTHVEYFGNDYLYNYKISNNQLSIIESNQIVLKYNIIKLSKDSLILQDPENVSEIDRYFKMKGNCNGNHIIPSNR